MPYVWQPVWARTRAHRAERLADVHLAGVPQAGALLRAVLDGGGFRQARLARAVGFEALQGAPLAAPVVLQVGGYFFGVTQAFRNAQRAAEFGGLPRVGVVDGGGAVRGDAPHGSLGHTGVVGVGADAGELQGDLPVQQGGVGGAHILLQGDKVRQARRGDGHPVVGVEVGVLADQADGVGLGWDGVARDAHVAPGGDGAHVVGEDLAEHLDGAVRLGDTVLQVDGLPVAFVAVDVEVLQAAGGGEHDDGVVGVGLGQAVPGGLEFGGVLGAVVVGAQYGGGLGVEAEGQFHGGAVDAHVGVDAAFGAAGLAFLLGGGHFGLVVGAGGALLDEDGVGLDAVGHAGGFKVVGAGSGEWAAGDAVAVFGGALPLLVGERFQHAQVGVGFDEHIVGHHALVAGEDPQVAFGDGVGGVLGDGGFTEAQDVEDDGEPGDDGDGGGGEDAEAFAAFGGGGFFCFGEVLGDVLPACHEEGDDGDDHHDLEEFHAVDLGDFVEPGDVVLADEPPVVDGGEGEGEDEAHGAQHEAAVAAGV